MTLNVVERFTRLMSVGVPVEISHKVQNSSPRIIPQAPKTGLDAIEQQSGTLSKELGTW